MKPRSLLMILFTLGVIMTTVSTVSLLSEPKAGVAIPPEYIPWDSIWVVESITFVDRGGKKRTKERGGKWEFYITRTKYDTTFGFNTIEDVQELKKGLEEMRELLEEAIKKGK